MATENQVKGTFTKGGASRIFLPKPSADNASISATIQIRGKWTGSVTLESSADQINWIVVNTFTANTAASGYALTGAPSTNSNFLYRLRTVSLTSGYVNYLVIDNNQLDYSLPENFNVTSGGGANVTLSGGGTSSQTATASGFLAGATITFYVNGVSVGTAVADGTGTATKALTGLANNDIVYAQGLIQSSSATASVAVAPITAGRLMSSRTVHAGFAGMSGSNGTTDLNSNTRSSHFNESGAAVNKLKLIYPGWYYTSTVSPAEQNAPNDFNLIVSIEYPAGTFTPVTIGTITIGNSVVSSEVTLATPIPANAQFWVRTYASVTAGQKWMLGYQINSNLGEASDRNTGTDLTLGGAIAGTNNGCGPIAILATNYSSGTPVTTIFAGFGDSTIEGATVNIQDIHGNQGWVGYACTSNAPYMNLARGGSFVTAQAGSMTKRLEIMNIAGVTHTAVGYGTNDYINLAVPATVNAALQVVWDAITTNGQKVLANTLAPVVTATFYNIPGYQTPATWSGTTSASYRGQTNTFIRTANPSIFQILDTTSLFEITPDIGIWKTCADYTGGAANPRIPAPRNVIIQAASTTTVFNTDLIIGSGITTNALSARQCSIVFTSGAMSGQVRNISANTLYGTTITTATPLASAPSAGDTATIYDVALTLDGTHSKALGHNSLLTLYYGGGFLEADYLCNLYFAKNATA